MECFPFSDLRIFSLYIYMDGIYGYNPNVSYEPNEGRYLQFMSAKDLYIQIITALEHDNHSDSFQVNFPKVFTNYPLGAVRVEDKNFIDCDHYRFTLWQTQLNFIKSNGNIKMLATNYCIHLQVQVPLA